MRAVRILEPHRSRAWAVGWIAWVPGVGVVLLSDGRSGVVITNSQGEILAAAPRAYTNMQM